MPSVHTDAQASAVRAQSVASTPALTAARSRQLVLRFVGWLDEFGECSQDPYDFWATSLGGHAKTLYYRRRLLGIAATAPFVLTDLFAPRVRSIVRRESRFPIADAHYALGFFRLGRETEGDRFVARARSYLDALLQTRSPAYLDPAWGYPFDWPARTGTYPAATPFITTVPYCYEAFELGQASVHDEVYLDTMKGIARFAAEHIDSVEIAPGASASAYSPIDDRRVVNASAYRGYLLTSAGRRFEREDWLDAGGRNLAFVLLAQRPDGSWPYSTDGEDFIDNFHTCFVLKNLVKSWAITGDESLQAAIRRGYAYYLDHLLDESGLPVSFARRPRVTLHRRDLYDYAEGIALAFQLRREIPDAVGTLERLVQDLEERWQLPDGHFATRELAVGRNTVPYHRWAQSQTFHALAQLVEAGP